MKPLQTQRERTLRLLENQGIMRLSELKADGIHPPTLARLVAEGVVVRSARGLYELADANFDLSHDLAEMAKRVPKGVVCLVSALKFHEITLHNTGSVWLAIGERDRKPKIDHPSVRFLRFGAKALTEGVEEHRIDGVAVKIFNPAKSVVDCFRYRKVVGLAIALEAMRMALRSRKTTAGAIADYAARLRVWSVIRPYLETAAADDT